MEKKQKRKWKISVTGLRIGLIALLAGCLFVGSMGNGRETAALSYEETGEMESEATETLPKETTAGETSPVLPKESETEETSRPARETEEETTEGNDGYLTDSNVRISRSFVRELYLYQYIEYGIRKYNETKQSDAEYYCDIEEDMLSYDAELGMEQEGAEPFKTDLAKELLPELANNLYNLCLHGEDETLYMQIDTYNMKIYIYDTLRQSD